MQSRDRGRRRARGQVLVLITLLTLTGCSGVKQELAAPAGTQEPSTTAAAGSAQLAVKPVVGYRAADFTATDVFSGEKVRLADLKGQVVFLNFWATWCPPCKEEMPAIENFHQEMGDKVRILALGADAREVEDKLARFAEAMELTFPVVYDKGSAATAYQVTGIPTSFFIDPEGVIRTRYTGPLTLEQMKAFAEEAGATADPS